MTTDYKYKNLKVSSRDKILSSDTNSDFHVKIDQIIHPAKDRCLGVSLESFSCENFFYNIRNGVNNTFSWEESTQTRQDIIFQEGQYLITQIINKLQADITANIITGSVVVSQDSITKKIKLVFSGTTARVVVDATSNMSETLGFSTTTGFLNTIEAPNFFRLYGLQQIYLESKELGHGQLFDTHTNNRRDILHVIPVKDGFGDVIFWDNNNSNDRVIWSNPRQLSVIHFRLTNADGQTLDIQNGRVTLNITLLY